MAAKGTNFLYAGSSTNSVYVTWKPPQTANRFLTVVDVACGNAVVQTVESNIVAGIWNEFTDLVVKRVADGHTLTYYKTPYDPNCPADVAGLLSVGDGRCGAWCRFMRDSIKVHVITNAPARQVVIKNEPGRAGHLFWVKNQDVSPAQQTPPSWPLPLPGIAGQGTDDPSLSYFFDHGVTTYGGMIYDPSYGKAYTSLFEWQNDSLDAISYNSGSFYRFPPWATNYVEFGATEP